MKMMVMSRRTLRRNQRAHGKLGFCCDLRMSSTCARHRGLNSLGSSNMHSLTRLSLFRFSSGVSKQNSGSKASATEVMADWSRSSTSTPACELASASSACRRRSLNCWRTTSNSILGNRASAARSQRSVLGLGSDVDPYNATRCGAGAAPARRKAPAGGDVAGTCGVAGPRALAPASLADGRCSWDEFSRPSAGAVFFAKTFTDALDAAPD
mmetsp:Transcript_9336/g.15514  ORF Transcript_9336/g.15514 Transcript_9336/m.15514 type:complete len:211 (+) Transcript_9336:2-634(+)